MAKYLDIIVIASLVCAANAQLTLQAMYNMGGVKGKVVFTQAAVGQSVNINIDLAGVRNNVEYTLEVHEFRVNFDAKGICSNDNIGMILGTTTTDSGKAQLTVAAGVIDLWGINTIEGRSFVMRDNSWVVCATIEADTEYVTAFANFPERIGGTMMLRQQKNSESAATSMTLYLYFVGEDQPQNALKWQINSESGDMESNSIYRCGGAIYNMYNPDGSSGTGCSNTDQAKCKIGDLSGKNGDVTIPTSGKTNLFFTDLNLPLSGQNSIIGKTIAFINGNMNYACATITLYPRMKAISKFSNDGVTGSLTFSQMSPLDPVNIYVNLQNLLSKAGGYHVHQWPVPQRMLKDESTCSSEHVGGHYNPLDVSTDVLYPAPATTTPDKYEVGDLSGKFGTLATMNSYDKMLTDPNMQLYGKNTIVGRSIVIHETEGARWICAPILPTADIPVKTAYARLTSPVIGYMTFRQRQDVPCAETLVYVELDNAHSSDPTVDHSWHVHATPVGDDMLSETGRCSSAGPHYNPFSVDLSGNYASMCNNGYHFRCEVGDLAGKHGKLNIRSDSGKKLKYFFSDMQLPLSGPQSIVGKSIVIHDKNSGAKRLACANIFEMVTRQANVSTWSSADGKGSPSGMISFEQICVDILAGITSIKVDLSGLNSAVAGYHIHEYPTDVNTPTSQVCQSSDVGGHFKPFGGPFPGPATGTLDMYEIGDLSGKFGPLTGAAYMSNMSDMTLAMDGPHSIVGRSIVIHENKQGAPRWACGNIVEVTPNSILMQQKAVFKGDIEGYIMLSQLMYENGDYSHTMVVVHLHYADDRTKITRQHNWHVHENRKSTDCASSGPHYNPLMVNVDSGYSECSMSNPLRCEMGDQSGKLGQYDIGAGKRFYTDVNLMIEGPCSAGKRSIVVHDANSAGSRIACANLMPYGPSVSMAHLNFSRTEYTVADVEMKVADFVGTKSGNILAVANSDKQCINTVIYFLGGSKETLRATFADNLEDNPGSLGKYAPSEDCPYVAGSGIISVSLLTVAACLLLSILRL